MSTYQFEISSKNEDPAWDDFVAACPDPHHEQLSHWGFLQKYSGWDPLRIIAKNGTAIAGGAQLLIKKAFPCFKVGYLKRGPLIGSADAQLSAQLIKAIKEQGKKQNIDYLAVSLPYSGSIFEKDLARAGFIQRPAMLPPKTTMCSTIVIDLGRDIEQIFNNMRDTTKKHIRQALKRGLSVRIGSDGDIETFRQLLLELCTRRGVKPNIETGEFINQLWKNFSSRGQIKLFIGEYKNEPVCAMLVLMTGAWAKFWRVGWSGKYSELRPNDLLHWEALKWAKENDIRYFDFVGFDTRAARAVVSGNEKEVEKICSVSQYKLGFGGNVMLLQPDYCYFFNPLARGILRLLLKIPYTAAALNTMEHAAQPAAT